MPVELPDFVAVGYVEKAHGIKGELKIQPLTDHPSRFGVLRSVQVEMRDGQTRVHEIEGAQVRSRCVILKLAGVDSRDAAAALRGAYINIPREDVLPLEDGDFYYFEVIGFEVATVEGQRLGIIEEVMDLPANAVLKVNEGDKEYLIPVIPEVIDTVDREGERIIINPISGLLDLA